jgi:hypothetical protein
LGPQPRKWRQRHIGILARRREYLVNIRAVLTESTVADYFAHYVQGKVERFDFPGVSGMNFVLLNVLGGGGMASLRNDPQGKTYAQMLLNFPVPVPAALATQMGES